MNAAYRAYRFVSTGLFFALFPPFHLYSRITGRHYESLGQRLGILPEKVTGGICGSPRIWIHAASVGEVNAATAIIDSLVPLMPDCAVILSTTTDYGQALARERLGTRGTCIYAPVDFVGAVRRAVAAVRPDVLACVETEIWPNWLAEARRSGIKTAVVNGRISVRSIKGYLKVRSLMADTLKNIDAFSMIGAADARRIRIMGAPRDRIAVNGNAKFDLALGPADSSRKLEIQKRYNTDEKTPVFVAGSTRNPEEKIILDAYQKICRSVPETLLVIAPRHVERAHAIADLVQARGLSYQFGTALDGKSVFRKAPVVIVDTIGELKTIYGLATVVFCGGSLVSRGGQNILEPAVWGKPVLYGPSMEDFLDAKDLLGSAGGGIEVKGGPDLAEKAAFYLTHPHEAGLVGESARRAVMSHKGAAKKHAEVISRLLDRVSQLN